MLLSFRKEKGLKFLKFRFEQYLSTIISIAFDSFILPWSKTLVGFIPYYFSTTLMYETLRISTTIKRSSHPEVFCIKGVLRNFAKFTGKHLYQGLLFNKVAGVGLFLQNTSGGCFCINLLFISFSPSKRENLFPEMSPLLFKKGLMVCQKLLFITIPLNMILVILFRAFLSSF